MEPCGEARQEYMGTKAHSKATPATPHSNSGPGVPEAVGHGDT